MTTSFKANKVALIVLHCHFEFRTTKQWQSWIRPCNVIIWQWRVTNDRLSGELKMWPASDAKHSSSSHLRWSIWTWLDSTKLPPAATEGKLHVHLSETTRSVVHAECFLGFFMPWETLKWEKYICSRQHKLRTHSSCNSMLAIKKRSTGKSSPWSKHPSSSWWSGSFWPIWKHPSSSNK